MKLADVSPVTDVGRTYMKQLDAAIELCEQEHSPEPLRTFGRQWSELAGDALACIEADGFEWEHLQDAWLMERKGRFCGEDAARRFGAILMPLVLMDVALVAADYKVPDGLALIRLVEAKHIVMKNGSLQRKDAPTCSDSSS